MTYNTIEQAFYFVSSSPPGECYAVVSRSTGEAFYRSEMLDEDDLPEDVDSNDDYVEIPHKNDLDLGKNLIMEFVQERCPQDLQYVRSIFSRRGAYQRYKAFLAEKNLLQHWYDFENSRTREALLEWCHEVGLQIEDERR